MEAQMESAQSQPAPAAGRLTADQRARLRELEGLGLSRTRVLRDLASATHPRHREVLESALKHLEEKITALNQAAPPGS
ncbi:MAG TPA: hypothetical protein VI455_05635 [Terriglobia bacterium]